ncbi:MAG: DUF2087 domain-containing protein [Streptosporangiaceae bacterium]
MDSLDSQPELRAFVQDGRITGMPAKRSRRLLLLDCVAQEFEPGRQYREAEVDAVLKSVYDDHAALRRYLIDEGLMARESGLYWRTGGTVDTTTTETPHAADPPGHP